MAGPAQPRRQTDRTRRTDGTGRARSLRSVRRSGRALRTGGAVRPMRPRDRWRWRAGGGPATDRPDGTRRARRPGSDSDGHVEGGLHAPASRGSDGQQVARGRRILGITATMSVGDHEATPRRVLPRVTVPFLVRSLRRGRRGSRPRVRVEDQRPVPVVQQPSRIVLGTGRDPPCRRCPVSILAPAARVRNERKCRSDQSGDSPVRSMRITLGGPRFEPDLRVPGERRHFESSASH